MPNIEDKENKEKSLRERNRERLEAQRERKKENEQLKKLGAHVEEPHKPRKPQRKG
jgi:hypothetical protein